MRQIGFSSFIDEKTDTERLNYSLKITRPARVEPGSASLWPFYLTASPHVPLLQRYNVPQSERPLPGNSMLSVSSFIPSIFLSPPFLLSSPFPPSFLSLPSFIPFFLLLKIILLSHPFFLLLSVFQD